MIMNAAVIMHARTTSQMMVVRLSEAGLLFWFWKLKGEEVCGDPAMISALCSGSFLLTDWDVCESVKS